MPKYVNEVNGLIVDYPADVAALFPALKPVPSEKAKARKVDDEPTNKDDKNGEVNAK